MSQSRHFIIFQRTSGHCTTWLARADSLAEAMTKYCGESCGEEILADGGIRTQGCGKAMVVYTHPLECIESEMKSYDGVDGYSWEIRELQEEHWQANFAEVFCSAAPAEVENHIRLCRPQFRQAFPQSRARAFVWYLKSGPLVTFHRRKEKRCRWPIEVLGRYHLPWKTWPQVNEWHGAYEAILEEMATEYPLPQGGAPVEDRTRFG